MQTLPKKSGVATSDKADFKIKRSGQGQRKLHNDKTVNLPRHENPKCVCTQQSFKTHGSKNRMNLRRNR